MILSCVAGCLGFERNLLLAWAWVVGYSGVCVVWGGEFVLVVSVFLGGWQVVLAVGLVGVLL